MPCICKPSKERIEKEPIIDVQKTIEDWAWKHFLKTTNKWKIFLFRNRFIVDVPMNYYLFEDGDADFQDMNQDPSKVRDPATQGRNHGNCKDINMDAANPNTSILSTKYVNDTGKDQVYKFRMERTRKASVSISCQKGFSLGGEAKFAIGVADGGVTSKFEVTNTRQEVFEESVLFETSSDINVEKRSDFTAIVVFTERETRMRFKLQTKMSLASGSAPIYIKRKRDGELVMLIKLTNLRAVFKNFEEKDVLQLVKEQFVDDVGDTYNVHAVKLFTEGIIEGVQLSDQSVKLRSSKIEDSTAIGSREEELEKHQEFHNPL